MPGEEQDGSGAADSRRWLVLGVIALAQLMIVLDATIMTHRAAVRRSGPCTSTIVDGQWVVTAHALAFGQACRCWAASSSDLLGRKGDVPGRPDRLRRRAPRRAAPRLNLGMLVACAGRPGRVRRAGSAPAALSLLAVTFSDPAERGRAFGVYGAVPPGRAARWGRRSAAGLTEYRAWRLVPGT